MSIRWVIVYDHSLYILYHCIVIFILFIPNHIRNPFSSDSTKSLKDRRNLSLDDFLVLQKNTNISLIDIRTLDELYYTWIIDWAKHIDYYSADFDTFIAKSDKKKTYVLYCNSWHRSADALITMHTMWYKDIYHIAWGIQYWIQQGKDLIPYSISRE